MAKIRHLAIRTEDTHRLATFYKEVFGLEELHRDRREGGAIFLSDGYFNLAILPNDEQNAPNGLYHFGFHVDSGDEIVEKIKKLNMSRLPKPRPKGRPYAETRASDPDGNFFDISEHGFQEVRPLGEKQSS
ncbi:MAG: VOC family protein [Candidatus Binatia bacterium]